MPNEPEQSISSGVLQLSGPWNANSHTTTPNLFSDVDKLYLSWVERDSVQSYLKYSALENETWDAEQIINQGDDWFINWADSLFLLECILQLIRKL